jgi:hypothetical protein
MLAHFKLSIFLDNNIKLSSNMEIKTLLSNCRGLMIFFSNNLNPNEANTISPKNGREIERIICCVNSPNLIKILDSLEEYIKLYHFLNTFCDLEFSTPTSIRFTYYGDVNEIIEKFRTYYQGNRIKSFKDFH